MILRRNFLSLVLLAPLAKLVARSVPGHGDLGCRSALLCGYPALLWMTRSNDAQRVCTIAACRNTFSIKEDT